MIASIVVDHLFKKFRNDPGIGIAFLYCNFQQQQEQRLIDLFLSLLKQFPRDNPFFLSVSQDCTRLMEETEHDPL
jgi:hypothetical protein